MDGFEPTRHDKECQGEWKSPRWSPMRSHFFGFLEPIPTELRGSVITIGNFDGVHRGHAALLTEARAQADRRGTRVIPLTFAPHPRELLNPGKAPTLLTTPVERDQLLHQFGADAVITLKTTQELLSLGARAFFDRVICDQLSSVALVEGNNFCFGYRREGTIQTLKEFCLERDLTLSIVPSVQQDGLEVSSSSIRRALETGQIIRANQFLGRNYRLEGKVGRGQQRGQVLGFPTANLEEVTTLIPTNGVYAVRAWIDSIPWPAACHIGPNPTFGEDSRKIEVHLIGFSGDLYGRMLKIDFVDRIREIFRFTSREELIRQLHQDIDNAKRLFPLD